MDHDKKRPFKYRGAKMPYDCMMRQKQTKGAVLSAQSIFHNQTKCPREHVFPIKQLDLG